MKIVSAQVTDQSEHALGLPDLCLPLGRSEAMRRVHDHIRGLASTDTTTLISGETGTGKELGYGAASAEQARVFGPYLCVNCGGLTDGLVESELFGHVKGAFTGACQERIGRFEAAHGGTLFLDEIGDISPAVQTRFLRVLETQCVEPVGSHRARKVNVRILAATNKKPLRRSGRRTISQRPLTIPERCHDRAASAPRAAGGHSAPRPLFPGRVWAPVATRGSGDRRRGHGGSHNKWW